MKVEIITVPGQKNDNLITGRRLKVMAGGFKFVFGSPESLQLMIDKFEAHPRGGECRPGPFFGEHFHQSSFARLPMRLKKKERRKIVAKRLREAMELWKKDPESQHIWRAYEQAQNA